MQLSRESISRAALGILDEYGLADVTMRRVASTLGVAPGALYWHIENKQELISAIASLIVSPLIDAPAHCSPAELCTRLRDTLLGHRDGAEVVITAMSQPGSAVAASLTHLMRAAVERELEGAEMGASTSDRRSAADGLLYMTLGATTVHQSASQLAEATGELPAAGRVAGPEVGPAVSFLVAGLRGGSA
ncbi:TetR family transcriptional regulator [Corynebacterium qintianiae]|uniref:TetR family transcriptional regulator n=1 Tax=Corynebacterium qintianiae TaxID=2709392 RepID=A0A7T0PFA6_9CORY|nr:TetR family transcriptional regulator [Corynebacterium qintianiae]QPK82652.1 TetR family transcriptional regulator [Corynebacterium qintianiae]